MRITILFYALTVCTFIFPTVQSSAFQDDAQFQPESVAKSVKIKPDDISSTRATDVSTVIAAIEAEANGDLATRSKLLATAIESGNLTPARWQTGQISQDGKRWNSIEESVALAKDNKLLQKYIQKKSGFQDNVESNLWLADWCVEVGLMPQARAHLERVIDIEPDHELARNLLGYRRADNDWISPQEISKISESSELKQASIRNYGKQISKLIGRMNSRRAKTRDVAISELMKLQEADAVGAVEAALVSENFAPSKLAIDWMSQIDTVESSLVLARYSLMHPDEDIRKYATSKLSTRPKYDFVPDMLEMLSSPISMTIVPSFNRNGSLAGYRQAFAREDFDGKEFVAIDRGFVRTPVTFVSRGSSVSRATAGMIERQLEQQVESQIIQQASEEVQNRAQTMEQQNQQITQVNERIATVISAVSEQPYSSDAKTMWAWWDRYNETEYQNYKPERYQRETITTETPRQFVSLPSRVVDETPTCECFVAGTPVTTSQGLRDIEDIVTGDLVLSRNINTGELSWNPVLRPTVRPPAATINISIDGESFCCSTGHLFWVSGAGWKRASELAEGDVLHGAEQPSLVTATSAGQTQVTHNLEVADNTNYFVGKNMILTHDVTPRETNRQTVPGQALLQYLDK